MLRTAVKALVGERVLRRLRARVDHGSWLFEEASLAWMFEPGRARQLPLPFRAFASYCRVAPRGAGGRVRGAGRLFRLALGLSRGLGCERSARLDLGGRVVFLCLDDPRFIAVPNELTRGAEIRALPELLGEGDTFLDVGANHGSFSIAAAEIVGPRGLVAAVEPQPRMARLVARSLAENARAPFEVHQVACSDREGTLELHVPRSSSGAASLYRGYVEGAACERVPVPVRRLDDLLRGRQLPGRLVVKLDVEGSEAAFLRGARETILRVRPQVMMEVNESSMRAASTTLPALLATLAELGYAAYREIADPAARPLASLSAEPQRNVVLLPGPAPATAGARR